MFVFAAGVFSWSDFAKYGSHSAGETTETVFLLPLRNFTTPSASANSVQSRPVPTLSPAWKDVPLCLTMIFPALTVSPPNFFTPSRLPAESLPFLELPPPFLVDMVSPFYPLISVIRTDV